MCAQLKVSRSGYYAWRHRLPSDRAVTDKEFTALISGIHRELSGNPGVRRVHAELLAQGYRIGRARVWRLMRLAGLQGRHPRPWKKTTVHGTQPAAAPDLIGRDFTAPAPNMKWCGDITYIKAWTGWVYLATVIDLHSRKVVGWAIADHMRTELVTDALAMALAARRPTGPVIFHSDRGTQYTSKEFDTYCRSAGVTRSLGRTGICYDNAVSESFFASIKKELIHTKPWPTLRAVKSAVFQWIEIYYNRRRRHSTLKYLTPEEFELGYRNITELAA